MAKPWIANMGMWEAEAFEPPPNTVMISITEPAGGPRTWREVPMAQLKPGYNGVLRLQFEDYDSERLHPKDAVLFTKDQADKIAAFAKKHRGSNIAVHCAAGISRSGAIADALLQAFPEYEDKGKPRMPNGHVRSLMKRSLGLVPAGFKSSGDQPRVPAGSPQGGQWASKGTSSGAKGASSSHGDWGKKVRFS